MRNTAEKTKVGDKYRDTPKDDILALIPGDAVRILDVGCGAGATGRELKLRRSCEIVGVEIDAGRAARAESRLDKVLHADVETADLPFEATFDCVVCADVLEHLRDPWAVVRKLRGYLRPGGSLVAGLPNVRHWRVLKSLVVSGTWAYEDSGVLDRDHLRFFARKDIIRMFEEAGFTTERLAAVSGSRSRFFRMTAEKRSPFDVLTGGLFRNILALQYVASFRKAGGFAE
ncbi:MAG: class I SAM-dependent methyltransferase [Acidobacteriota bacterium]|nr:class I SAM-dependent methyltransferase [Acidobacteriota bacterium]